MLRHTWSRLVHTAIAHAASMFGNPETAMTHIYLTVLIVCSSLARMSHRTYIVLCIRISIVHKLAAACASMFALKGVWKWSLCMAYIQAHHQQAIHHLDAPATLSVSSLVIPLNLQHLPLHDMLFVPCTCCTSQLHKIDAASLPHDAAAGLSGDGQSCMHATSSSKVPCYFAQQTVCEMRPALNRLWCD